jgi:sugar/nucleoside kinase (ribokinase family)
MKSILCIGDAMIDVIVKMKSEINLNSDTLSDISMHGGGAAANTATWLAHLGVNTTFAGRIGSDIAGANFHAELVDFGVKHLNSPIAEAKTGTVVVLVDKQGNRTMFPDSGANSGLSASDLPELSEFDSVFLSGYSLFNPASIDGVTEIINAIRELKIPIFFDVASVGTMSAFGKERALSLISGFSGLFLNEEEARYITGSSDTAQQLQSLVTKAPLIVIKRGALGAIAKVEDEAIIEQPATHTKVIDTTGAGDAFAAGFLAAWLERKNLSASLSHALDIAAQCVATIGARPRVNP